jgi:hypothetical protein
MEEASKIPMRQVRRIAVLNNAAAVLSFNVKYGDLSGAAMGSADVPCFTSSWLETTCYQGMCTGNVRNMP